MERVRNVEQPPFRPQVAGAGDEAELIDLMRMCWEEIEEFRPNFGTICDILKKMTRGK